MWRLKDRLATRTLSLVPKTNYAIVAIFRRGGSTFNYDQARSPSQPALSTSSSSSQLYMTYQPQFGLCNQLRALHQAIAIARVLGRILVVPDVIDDDGKGPIYRRDTLFDTESLINVLNNAGDGKVYAISTAAYSKLGLSTPKFVLDLKLQSFIFIL